MRNKPNGVSVNLATGPISFLTPTPGNPVIVAERDFDLALPFGTDLQQLHWVPPQRTQGSAIDSIQVR